MKSDQKYTKLSKRCGSIVSLAQLWAGKDHIMLVEESMVTQSYRRFYFKDIEGLLIKLSSRHIWYLISFLALAGILARIAESTEGFETAGLMFLWILIIGSFILGAIWQLIAGKFSTLLVQTKNGPYKFPIRLRYSKMKRLVNKLIPLIKDQQQTNIEPEEFISEKPALEESDNVEL